MAKLFGTDGGKPQPKDNMGVSVGSGLSISEKFDSKQMDTAPLSQEQARTKQTSTSAGKGFTFKGN